MVRNGIFPSPRAGLSGIEESHSNQLCLSFYLLFGVKQASTDGKNPKARVSLENIWQEQIFPRPAMISPGAKVQKEPSAPQLCRHADKLTSISDMLKDGLFFWWPRRLSKLHVFKLLETGDASADATDVCTHIVQVCARNPIYLLSTHILCLPPISTLSHLLLMHVCGLFISATNLEKSVHRVS